MESIVSFQDIGKTFSQGGARRVIATSRRQDFPKATIVNVDLGSKPETPLAPLSMRGQSPFSRKLTGQPDSTSQSTRHRSIGPVTRFVFQELSVQPESVRNMRS
jgi:hypothetical protein